MADRGAAYVEAGLLAMSRGPQGIDQAIADLEDDANKDTDD